MADVLKWGNPQFYAHAIAALSEGFCPDGHGRLYRVRAADGGAAGFCQCGWWHHILASEEIQWSLPYDPGTGLPRTPGWVA